MIPIFDIPAVRRLLFMQKSRARTNLARMRALSKSLASESVVLSGQSGKDFLYDYEIYYDVADMTEKWEEEEMIKNHPYSFKTILPKSIFPLSQMHNLKIFTIDDKMGPLDYVRYDGGEYYGPEILATFSSDIDIHDAINIKYPSGIPIPKNAGEAALPTWINDWYDKKGRPALGFSFVHHVSYDLLQKTTPGYFTEDEDDSEDEDDVNFAEVEVPVYIYYYLLDVTGLPPSNRPSGREE